MILTKNDIEKSMQLKDILIYPFHDKYLGLSSYDIHLSRVLQINIGNGAKEHDLINDGPYMLGPHECVLGCSLELIGVPGGKHEGRIDGTSSLGRKFITTHVTASKLNPLHTLHLTLEIVNFLNVPISLLFGMPSGQITFEELKTPIDPILAEKMFGGGRSYGEAKFNPRPVPELSRLDEKTRESNEFFLGFLE